jgi:hypothetical protein
MIGGWTAEYGVQLEFVNPDDGLELMLATGDSTAVTFDGQAKIGVTGDGTVAGSGRYKLLLTNKPDLVATTAISEQENATGYADNTEEDVQALVAQPATFAPEASSNTYLASLFLSLLAQNGYTESAAGAIRTGVMVPHTTPNITRYLAIVGVVQKLATNAAPTVPVKDDNALIRGGLPTSVKLSAAEGEMLKITADMQGAKWAKGFALPAAYVSTTGVPVKVPFLKWQNALVILQDAYTTANDPTSGIKVLTGATSGTQRISMQGFDLTLTNGLSHKFYNSNTIMAFVLGKFKAEGNMVIPWYVANALDTTGLGGEAQYYWQQIQDLQNGITKRLIIYWNAGTGFTFTGSTNTMPVTTDAVNGLLIDMFIKYKSGGLDRADVLGSNMGFTCVQPIAGTPSVKIMLTYAATGTNATRRV